MIDDVMYEHGISWVGKDGALDKAKKFNDVLRDRSCSWDMPVVNTCQTRNN